MIGSIVSVAAGVIGVAWILISVVRTVVIPRPERVWLTAAAFEGARRFTRLISRRLGRERRHQLLGAFAPTVLITLPLVWSLGLVASFSAVFWGLDVGSVADSVELSFSSLTTLGFVGAPDTTTRLVAGGEALMGLAIVALMISFLPTLYGTFSRREIAVGRLTTRAGAPPNPVEFIVRLDAIGQLEHVGNRWDEWEDWFVELGETHTTFPALIYFRSAHPDRSWLTAAEVALDTAALLNSIGVVDGTGRSDTLIRSGYLALRSVADFYRIEPEQSSFEQLSVTRAEFEAMLDDLADTGFAVTVDRSQAWTAFAGWRVNYDRAVCGLRDLVGDLPSHWSHPDRRLSSSS